MSHAAAARSGEPPLAEGRGRTVKQRAETCLRLRADDRIGTGEYVELRQSTATPSEGDAGKHRVRRAEGREKRGTCNIAVRRVMNPAEVVGYGIGDGIAHAHRAGVMMGGSEIVPARRECSERRQSLGRRAGGHRNHARSTGRYFKWLAIGRGD